MRNDVSPIQFVDNDGRSSIDGRAVLVAHDEVTCWTERIPSGRYGAAHRNVHWPIMLVLSGGPAEVLDSADRVHSRSLVTAGQLIRGDQLPSTYRVRNLGDRVLVLVVVEPSKQN